MKTKYNSTLSAAGAKSGDQTQNKSIRRKWSALALGGFLFTSLLALSAPPVEAQCQQWSVGHGWRFKQGTTPVDMNLQQKGTVITGKASFTGTKSKSEGFGDFGEVGLIYGDVDGTVEGDSFAVRIHWDNNTTGVYDGTIGPSGRIEGKGYNQATPRTKVRWYSETRMVCADANAVSPTTPTPDRPPPIRKSGKWPATPTPARPPPIKSSGKAKTSAAAPTISAQPILVTIPDGQSHGRTTLTWDGGPDHPDAEVWMKGSSQEEETLVVQQGKGTRSVTVELGQNYRFILKDAGQQLAQAAVLTKSRP